jgi:predicted Rossmann-fold nucleotide-binding protein
MRKIQLAMRAYALVVFPGGFGTMDEFFELLTLRQTDKSPRIPIVLFDRAYWSSVVNFEQLVKHGMIDRADLDLFGYAEDAEGIWAELLARGLKPHESIELTSEQTSS